MKEEEINNYQINRGITLYWKSEMEKWEFYIPSTKEEQSNVHIINETVWISNPISLGNDGSIYVDCKYNETIFIAIRKGILTHTSTENDEIKCESVDILNSKNHTKYLLKKINDAVLNRANYLNRQDLLNFIKTNELLDEGKEVPVGLITELEIIHQKALH